jgi:DNA (cytosine-5)-methyltransferase 1
MNYYNEWEPFAAEWLKELIKEGLIPEGDVDSRSIEDVRLRELKGYTQCHFFAGIGGWSRALELAGWSPDRPVWTGSPPCQSFSVAGKGKGKDDERHLWPVFFNLIRECQPPAVFGEQVAAAIRYGWLDDLQKDFEKEGYASGACVLPSGGVGSPHKRDRLFFTAKFVADALNKGLQGHRELGQESVEERRERKKRHCTQSSLRNNSCDINGGDFWSDSTVVHCRDGKHRPVPTESALFPLANGIPNRVGILRGAGNAIVPQAGAEIIKAFMSSDVY